MDSINVTVDDIKHVAKTHFAKFFDPKRSCCALLACDQEEMIRIMHRLEDMGYKMEFVDLHSLCSNL